MLRRQGGEGTGIHVLHWECLHKKMPSEWGNSDVEGTTKEQQRTPRTPNEGSSTNSIRGEGGLDSGRRSGTSSSRSCKIVPMYRTSSSWMMTVVLFLGVFQTGE